MDNYAVMRCIGRGSYGAVYLCRDKRDEKHYVVKKIDVEHVPTRVCLLIAIFVCALLNSRQERGAAEQEVKLLASLNHPNIVGYRESFNDTNSSELCIVMAYCEGGDLYSRIQKQKGVFFDEKVLVTFLYALVSHGL